jgi:hypothetical protein
MISVHRCCWQQTISVLEECIERMAITILRAETLIRFLALLLEHLQVTGSSNFIAGAFLR